MRAMDQYERAQRRKKRVAEQKHLHRVAEGWNFIHSMSNWLVLNPKYDPPPKWF